MKTILKMILFSAIILILFIPSSGAIYDNHKSVVCIYCHIERGFSYGVTNDDDEDDCGNCHYYSMNIPKLEAEHNPKTCKVCHNVKDLNSYHILHKNVTGSCTTCHGEDGQTPGQSINDCPGCHGGKIHIVHQDKLSQICEKCHGSRPASGPASDSVSVSSDREITARIYAKVVNYKQFTLFEVFKRILSS
jgi:hypothetical protein